MVTNKKDMSRETEEIRIDNIELSQKIKFIEKEMLQIDEENKNFIDLYNSNIDGINNKITASDIELEELDKQIQTLEIKKQNLKITLKSLEP